MRGGALSINLVFWILYVYKFWIIPNLFCMFVVLSQEKKRDVCEEIMTRCCCVYIPRKAVNSNQREGDDNISLRQLMELYKVVKNTIFGKKKHVYN